jgi:hypothetical protein
MKKQLLLAALATALLVSPFADAASGFSRGSGSSKTTTSSPAKSASKSNYGSYSGFGSSSSKKADAPRITAFTPTAVSRQGEPAPAAAPSPAKSGFGSSAKSGVGKTVATVATASALGGAMYSASANHDAVAAYEAKQKAAAAQVAPPVSTASTQDSSHGSSATTQANTSYQPRQQPQVIVVQQSTPHYRDSSMLGDAYWYERGRAAARRDERERDYQRDRDYQNAQAQAAQAQAAQGGYAPSVQAVPPSVAAGTPTATAQTSLPTMRAAPVSTPAHTSHTGLILLAVLILAAIGIGAFLVLRGKKTDKPAKKANYTL